jgi:hypothetical protein
MSNEKALEKVTTTEAPVAIGWETGASFTHTQRVATMLSKSTLVPDTFRGEQNLGNAIIALNMATRMGADVLSVMQSIYVVHGKPSWSSTFIIAAINSSKRFAEELKWKMEGAGDSRTATAWTRNKNGEVVEGPPVSIEMAKAEGWMGKAGSKWKTMPELMLRYRAATFFGRLYCPDLLLGMRTSEEVFETEIDITPKAAPKPAHMFTSVTAPAPSVEAALEPVTIALPVEVAPPVQEDTSPPVKPAVPPPVAEKPNAVPPWLVLQEKCATAGVTFTQLKEWNSRQEQQFGGLGDEAIGFSFLTRSQATAILRVLDSIISDIFAKV